MVLSVEKPCHFVRLFAYNFKLKAKFYRTFVRLTNLYGLSFMPKDKRSKDEFWQGQFKNDLIVMFNANEFFVTGCTEVHFC